MLFWIDSGSHKRIMSAWLNGQNSKVLVDTNLDSPHGLAIDFYKNNRIYWCDEKYNFIESINVDGSDRVRIYHAGLIKPYKIDIFENYVYFLSRETGKIAKIDKFGRGALVNLVDNLDLADDFKVFHSLKATRNCNNNNTYNNNNDNNNNNNKTLFKIVVNPCLNANCSHLCLLKPDQDFECSCPQDSNFLNNDLFTCDSGKLFHFYFSF
jgi:low density lipoprotein-related protein 2